MSYLVTARKWRPQRFEEVVGQSHVTQTLKNAIATGRIAHAYLFDGTRGIGKTTIARILAKALNCVEGPTPVPCNQCAICQEIAQGNSIDVLEIDGASNRGIDEVRELRENIKYMPAKGRYKIYIIDEVHMLTKEAFNALLKTLEEPPSHVIFILATTEPHKIPNTILSRCQRFHLRLVDLPDIVGRLELIAEREGISIEREALLQIARRAQGSMRDAQSFLDLVVSYAGNTVRKEDIEAILGGVDFELIYEMVECMAEKNPARILELAQRLSPDQQSLKEFCSGLAEYIRDMIITRISNTPERFIACSPHELERIKGLAEKFSLEELGFLFNIILEVDKNLRLVSNLKIFLEVAMVKMALVKPVAPVENLIERLLALERKLSLPASIAPPAGQEPVEERPEQAPQGTREEIDLAESSLDELWEKIKQNIAQKNGSLATFLEHMSPRELSENRLTLELDKRYEFYFKDDQIKKQCIKEAIYELTGKTIEPKFQITEQRIENPPTGEQADKRQGSIIEEALEIFGGQIIR